MILSSLKFEINFQGFHHLLQCDCGTTNVMQHLHREGWAWKSMFVGQSSSIVSNHDELEAQSPHHLPAMVSVGRPCCFVWFMCFIVLVF